MIETIYLQNNFEQKYFYEHDNHPFAVHAIAALALKISRLTEELSNVERIPRYSDGRRENDVEHSYMLALVAPEIAAFIRPDLNKEKIMSYALCHDLIEIKTGDVPTFNLSPAELAQKELREEAAKAELLNELPSGIAVRFREYVEQLTDEAVFVRTIDKLLPVAVDIIGQGQRVMREDYGITSNEGLRASHDALHERVVRKFGECFPELIGAHAVLCAMFVEHASKNFLKSNG